MTYTPLTALAYALEVPPEEASRYIDRLATLGFKVVTDEMLQQLRDSYHKMLMRYYECDLSLARTKNAMHLLLQNRQLTLTEALDVIACDATSGSTSFGLRTDDHLKDC